MKLVRCCIFGSSLFENGQSLENMLICTKNNKKNDLIPYKENIGIT